MPRLSAPLECPVSDMACQHCRGGYGNMDGSVWRDDKCDQCDGTGKERHDRHGVERAPFDCRKCLGAGTHRTHLKRCWYCKREWVGEPSR